MYAETCNEYLVSKLVLKLLMTELSTRRHCNVINRKYEEFLQKMGRYYEGCCFFAHLKMLPQLHESRDSSVGIALGYGLDNRGSRIRFPAEVGNFSLHHRVQNGSGAHPASHPMYTRGSFLGGKVADA
jgi:hypothetical protein